MAPIPHRIILLKEINEKVTQRSLLSIILSAYIYEQHSISGSKSQKVSPFLQMCFYMYKLEFILYKQLHQSENEFLHEWNRM